MLETFTNVLGKNVPTHGFLLQAIDYEMVIPTYLENSVKQETINQLANVYLKVPKEELPNLNANQITTDPKQTNK